METAIADIIDNSISADADEINIDFSWNDGDPWLAITDNGHGMTRTDLISAMRFGSVSPFAIRSSNDMGRFGLGLKTASLLLQRKVG
jgi:DNA mismatch repair ATPase MutL